MSQFAIRIFRGHDSFAIAIDRRQQIRQLDRHFECPMAIKRPHLVEHSGYAWIFLHIWRAEAEHGVGIKPAGRREKLCVILESGEGLNSRDHKPNEDYWVHLDQYTIKTGCPQVRMPT